MGPPGHRPEDAGQTRSEAWSLLLRTLLDASIGFVAGMLAAVLLAGAIVLPLPRGVESAVMPVAMILRSVPLIALAPIIILLVGRGFASFVAVMSGIVVLFPALVSIVFGLRSSSPADARHRARCTAARRGRCSAGSPSPPRSPALFASVRISVPGAITVVWLAEWLATGKGIGGAVGGYIAQAQFSALWASVVVVTAVSLVLYNVVQIAENVVLARMGMHPDTRV